MDNKTYPRQKKEPEMLNDFGPAGGYDCIEPGAPKLGNKSKANDKAKKDNIKFAGDILNPSEERGE